MNKYMIIENGVAIERVDGDEALKARFNSLMREGEAMSFRRAYFDELTEMEKVEKMRSKLEKLNKHLEEMKGSGRTYYSHTRIESDELSWLLDNTEKYLNLQR